MSDIECNLPAIVRAFNPTAIIGNDGALVLMAGNIAVAHLPAHYVGGFLIYSHDMTGDTPAGLLPSGATVALADILRHEIALSEYCGRWLEFIAEDALMPDYEMSKAGAGYVIKATRATLKTLLDSAKQYATPGDYGQPDDIRFFGYLAIDAAAAVRELTAALNSIHAAR